MMRRPRPLAPPSPAPLRPEVVLAIIAADLLVRAVLLAPPLGGPCARCSADATWIRLRRRAVLALRAELQRAADAEARWRSSEDHGDRPTIAPTPEVTAQAAG